METDTINWSDPTTRQWLTGKVARPESGDTRRRCFYVDDVRRDPRGVIALLVFEDVPGYEMLTGSNPPDSTWYWGSTEEEAWKIADLVNAELFGLTHADAVAIVGSSISAQIVQAGDTVELYEGEAGLYLVLGGFAWAVEPDNEVDFALDAESLVEGTWAPDDEAVIDVDELRDRVGIDDTDAAVRRVASWSDGMVTLHEQAGTAAIDYLGADAQGWEG